MPKDIIITVMVLQLLTRIRARVTEWRRKRKWSDRKQLAWIRQTIVSDQQWMAHDPVAVALTQRYLSMLGDKWETVSIPHSGDFRAKIGLDPHYTSNYIAKVKTDETC